MDIYQIIVAPKARREIEKIAEYVRGESEQAAELIGDKIDKAIGSLNIFPQRHPIRDRRRDPARNTYGMVVFSYIIYYRIDDAAKIVRVTTVIHGARRQPKRFR